MGPASCNTCATSRRAWQIQGLRSGVPKYAVRSKVSIRTSSLCMNANIIQFRFQPISIFDIFTLSACYLCTAVYLAVSLRRLRAVKSRFGLILTVLTQVLHRSPIPLVSWPLDTPRFAHPLHPVSQFWLF
jgi:hypothetical protein